MRLVTIKTEQGTEAGIVLKMGVLPVDRLNSGRAVPFATDILSLIQRGELSALQQAYAEVLAKEADWAEDVVPFDSVQYAPLYTAPPRIFGIGLNYRDHAADLAEQPPDVFPGSFYKPASTIIGPGDAIRLPALSQAVKTTAEGELGIILSKVCRDVDEKDWQSCVAGYTTALDMTEESILRLNPRYLTIAKSFETFFSFGPQLVTPDEVPDPFQLKVQSVLNGKVHAENYVSNMTHQLPELIALHSRIQGWLPGDILSTGTPRAFPIQEGDVAECRIIGPDGFAMEPLRNPVIDLKKKREEEK